MTNYVYNDEFDGITGTIDGGDFDPHFSDIEAAIASKGDLAGPQTYTGTHTFATLIATTTLAVAGEFDTVAIAISLDATAVATSNFDGILATGSIAGNTLAGAADTTNITGGTWA